MAQFWKSKPEPAPEPESTLLSTLAAVLVCWVRAPSQRDSAILLTSSRVHEPHLQCPLLAGAAGGRGAALADGDAGAVAEAAALHDNKEGREGQGGAEGRRAADGGGGGGPEQRRRPAAAARVHRGDRGAARVGGRDAGGADRRRAAQRVGLRLVDAAHRRQAHRVVPARRRPALHRAAVLHVGAHVLGVVLALLQVRRRPGDGRREAARRRAQALLGEQGDPARHLHGVVLLRHRLCEPVRLGVLVGRRDAAAVGAARAGAHRRPGA